MRYLHRFVRSIASTRALSLGSSFTVIILLVVVPARAQSLQPKFAYPVEYSFGVCQGSAVALADVNGDGITDLVVAGHGSSELPCTTFDLSDGVVGVMLGNGDGTFQPALTYDSGGFWPTSVAVADFDGDGHQDIVVLNCAPPGATVCSPAFQTQVGVLLGRGNGDFQPVVTHGSGGYGWVESSVAVGDFNGDGHPDLAISAYCTLLGCVDQGGVQVMLGNGDGTFQSPVSFEAGSGVVFVSVSDLNGDGKLDLVAVAECPVNNCTSSVGVLLGNGDGTFQNVVTYDITQYSASAVTIGDLNGDGHPDLVVSNRCGALKSCYAGSVTVLLNKGGGTFRAPVSYKTHGYYSYSAAIVDLNLDGIPDLAVTNRGVTKVSTSEKRLGILLGNGDGTFQAATNYLSDGNGVAPQAIVAGDFNGDGRLDLALADNCFFYTSCTNGVSVLLNSTQISTTTAIASSLNPSRVGQSVTFTATITSTPTVPDGEVVTFSNGFTQLGTGTTAGGVATFTTSSLKSGNHVIKAAYVGDVIFKPSSKTLTQVVNK